MQLALDPTPYHHSHTLLEFAEITARLGYEHMHLSPHADFIPFFRHPRADRALIAAVKKSARDAGVTIPALLPVQRISAPDETLRAAAVRNWKRIIQIAVDLEVPVINTEFSGRPENVEASEDAFYRSMAELLPIIEGEGIRVNFDPHPDDFVEDGLEALRVIRGLDSASVGFVYVASHTFHLGNRPAEIIAAAGDRLAAVYVADTFDHTRSHGLRYISNPPGNAVRVHQHLKIGQGDVNWAELFRELRGSGFLDRPGSMIASNVFAEDEDADAVSRYQRESIEAFIA